MRKILLLLSAIFVLIGCSRNPIKYDEPYTLADTCIRKDIIIFFTISDCSLCDSVDAIFSDKKVKSYIEKNFLIIKMNLDKDSTFTFRNRQFNIYALALIYKVDKLPKVMFLDEDRMPLAQYTEMFEPDDLHKVLKFIHEKIYKTKTMQEYWKQ